VITLAKFLISLVSYRRRKIPRKKQMGQSAQNCFRTALAVCASAALVACQSDPNAARPTTTAVAGAPAGFQCPSAGTRILFGSGARVHRGPDPADPFVCLATGSNGQSERFLGNFLLLPTSDDAAHRQALAQLLPPVPGKTVDFTYASRTNDGTPFRSRWTYRVVGPRNMNIAGSDREVIVIERDQQNANWSGYLAMWTFYYDPASRTVLGGDIRVTRGQDGSRPWRASGVELPRGT
jgi:hypothetical protein